MIELRVLGSRGLKWVRQRMKVGARRLVDRLALPDGKGAAPRILRDAKLVRPRPRQPRRKADLRALKAAHPPLLRLPMDIKYLNDLPHSFP